MKKLFLLFLLTGCANVNTPHYEPADNEEYIEQLEATTDQKIKADTLQVYTYVGAALFAAGVIMVALTPRFKSGIVIILGGLLAMGTPFILNAVWFDWVFGVGIGIALFYILYFLFRKTADYISSKRNDSNNE